MKLNFISRNKNVIVYGASLAVLLLVLKWIELRFIIYDHATEIYTGIVALVFTGLGVWLALKLAKPRIETVIIEKEVYRSEVFVFNDKQMRLLGLSLRELEVLGCMADGLSNDEIANQLFVSVNTVKTHSSRLFEKLAVKRRTQAVEKAKRLQLIP